MRGSQSVAHDVCLLLHEAHLAMNTCCQALLIFSAICMVGMDLHAWALGSHLQLAPVSLCWRAAAAHEVVLSHTRATALLLARACFRPGASPPSRHSWQGWQQCRHSAWLAERQGHIQLLSAMQTDKFFPPFQASFTSLSGNSSPALFSACCSIAM